MKRSLGFRAYHLATGSVAAALAGSVINVYSGTVPSSPNDALSSDAMLLCTYSLNGSGAGVSMATDASGGTLSKNTSEVWKGSVVNSGTARFFRLQKPEDDNSASTTAIRLQGTIAQMDADIELDVVQFTMGTERRLDTFLITSPEG